VLSSASAVPASTTTQCLEIMSDKNDTSRAVALLKQTLPEMNKRNIATTPENYAVWYEYVSGDNPDLVNEINLLELNKTAFTTEVHRDLYNRYIAGARESAINKLSEGVKEVIAEYLKRASVEGKGLNTYAQTLSQFSSDMQGVNDILDIKGMISSLIDETHKRETATEEMSSALTTMANEMRKLRTEVARLNAEATTDSLTKVSNRRAFDLDIEQLMSSAVTENSPLTLIILDIDKFGTFNNKFGNVIGDKVLRFVATLFKKNIKGGDSIARLADDEFGILLPETDYKGALMVAENVRDKLAKQTLSDSAAKIQLGTITVSCGVASFVTNEYPEEFIARASACLREAQKKENFVFGEDKLPKSDNNSNVRL
jgi:diguanylate cyclase